jgi:hypothetical protein
MKMSTTTDSGTSEETLHEFPLSASEHAETIYKSGKWSDKEQNLFKECLEKYGHNWLDVSTVVKTRSRYQVSVYYCKNYSRQKEKSAMEMSTTTDSVTSEETLHEFPLTASERAATIYKSGKWSDEEQNLFKEGLEKYEQLGECFNCREDMI